MFVVIIMAWSMSTYRHAYGCESVNKSHNDLISRGGGMETEEEEEDIKRYNKKI
jgi:hypothetical protein